MKTIAIHQPNYLPWLGFFYKISCADVFVILDDVDFQSGNASSLTNRSRFKGPNGPFWLTVPVKSKGNSKQISDILIDSSQPWQKKHLKTLQGFYGKTPYYQLYIEKITEILQGNSSHLSQLNTALILKLCEVLEINTEILLSSQLNENKLQKDEKIVAICSQLKATHYLSGHGAKKYMRPQIFEKADITLIYTNFSHPEYPQPYGEFIPGLSTLDALFNLGPDTLKYITPQPWT